MVVDVLSAAEVEDNVCDTVAVLVVAKLFSVKTAVEADEAVDAPADRVIGGPPVAVMMKFTAPNLSVWLSRLAKSMWQTEGN